MLTSLCPVVDWLKTIDVAESSRFSYIQEQGMRMIEQSIDYNRNPSKGQFRYLVNKYLADFESNINPEFMMFFIDLWIKQVKIGITPSPIHFIENHKKHAFIKKEEEPAQKQETPGNTGITPTDEVFNAYCREIYKIAGVSKGDEHDAKFTNLIRRYWLAHDDGDEELCDILLKDYYGEMSPETLAKVKKSIVSMP